MHVYFAVDTNLPQSDLPPEFAKNFCNVVSDILKKPIEVECEAAAWKKFCLQVLRKDQIYAWKQMSWHLMSHIESLHERQAKNSASVHN